jgi:hypothetical protein
VVLAANRLAADDDRARPFRLKTGSEGAGSRRRATLVLAENGRGVRSIEVAAEPPLTASL